MWTSLSKNQKFINNVVIIKIYNLTNDNTANDQVDLKILIFVALICFRYRFKLANAKYNGIVRFYAKTLFEMVS